MGSEREWTAGPVKLDPGVVIDGHRGVDRISVAIGFFCACSLVARLIFGATQPRVTKAPDVLKIRIVGPVEILASPSVGETASTAKADEGDSGAISIRMRVIDSYPGPPRGNANERLRDLRRRRSRVHLY